MLFADKRALETNLQVSLLKIREKELQFYTQNCIAIGTQVAPCHTRRAPGRARVRDGARVGSARRAARAAPARAPRLPL